MDAIVVEGLEKKLLTVKLSADAALMASELSTRLAAGSATRRDLFLHVLQNGLAEENGELLSKPDAEALLSIIPLQLLNALAGELTKVEAVTEGK